MEMSLTMLFDKATVSEMMTAWLTKPALHVPPDDSRLPSTINAELINGYLDTGTAPADQLIVIKDGAALHSRAYTTDGYLEPGKIAKWRGRGYTIQLRNLHRWCPAVHAICSAIQTETTAPTPPASSPRQGGKVCITTGTRTWASSTSSPVARPGSFGSRGSKNRTVSSSRPTRRRAVMSSTG